MEAELSKVIISGAVTGAVHTPSMSPHLPIRLRAAPEQAVIIRSILEKLSMEVATPAEARKVLHLEGADNVGF